MKIKVSTYKRLMRAINDLQSILKEVKPESRNERPADSVTYTKDTDILQLPLSTRACHCLVREHIYTVGDLLECSRARLLRIRNFGRHSLIEVEDFCAANNFKLKN